MGLTEGNFVNKKMPGSSRGHYQEWWRVNSYIMSTHYHKLQFALNNMNLPKIEHVSWMFEGLNLFLCTGCSLHPNHTVVLNLSHSSDPLNLTNNLSDSLSGVWVPYPLNLALPSKSSFFLIHLFPFNLNWLNKNWIKKGFFNYLF